MFKIRFDKKIAFSNNSKALPLKGIGRPTLLGNLRFSVVSTSTSLECHGERPSTTLRRALSERSEPNGRSRTIRRGFYTLLNHKRGLVLFMVLGMLLVVVSLATAILSLILSHARLTHHQTSRIQAYYASMAGMNYALERLRLGDVNWIPSPDTAPNTRTRTLCKGSCDVNDGDIPYPVTIIIGAAGTSIDGVGRSIIITTTY